IESHTPVPTSIWQRRNSELTWPAIALSQSASSRDGGSLTRSRVSRSTRRYSSSMPTVKAGSASIGSVPRDLERCRLRQQLAEHAAQPLGPFLGAVMCIDEVLAQLDQHVGQAAVVAVDVDGVAVEVASRVGLVVADADAGLAPE